eukprot:TRINITY_DN8805_c0_g6_i1.p1 TRINITY_DN8805_c0_g6~~TRINITY_DN8805_c0_g6_i1.p1  ORF type:complete len:747 (-),score=141.72 TRINITY_DN8805_c0_g6_i1:145-2385(-)
MADPPEAAPPDIATSSHPPSSYRLASHNHRMQAARRAHVAYLSEAETPPKEVEDDESIILEVTSECGQPGHDDDDMSLDAYRSTQRASTLTVCDPDIIMPEGCYGPRSAVVLDNTRNLASVASMQSMEWKKSFIRSADDEAAKKNKQEVEPPSFRKFAKQLTKNPYYDFAAGFVVLLDFVAICRDTDAKAAAPGGAELFASITMNACFIFYVADLSLRVFLYGLKLFRQNKAFALDLFVICVSVFEHVLEFVRKSNGGSSFLMVRMIRLCRLLRLVRVVKLFAGMKELRRLTQMIATCARTMFWSFLLSFLVMSMWAVLAVELVHPVVIKLVEQGQWPDCERCERAFSSVMQANLTFFQTILAGDSWGQMAIPICEDSPLTGVVFCGALLTLSYGIMQLITAVVVDSFADLRKLDVNSLATEIDAEEKMEKEALRRIFEKIDADESGQVTFQELADGASSVKEFRDWLRVMDIDASDLARLFVILDGDGSGEVDVEEFMDALYRLKNAESRTTTKLVKHIVDAVEKKQDDMFDRFAELQTNFDEMRMLSMQRHAIESEDEHHCSQKDDQMVQHVEAAVQRASAVALEAALSAAINKVHMLTEAGSRPQLTAQRSVGASKASTCAPSRTTWSSTGSPVYSPVSEFFLESDGPPNAVACEKSSCIPEKATDDPGHDPGPCSGPRLAPNHIKPLSSQTSTLTLDSLNREAPEHLRRGDAEMCQSPDGTCTPQQPWVNFLQSSRPHAAVS